MYEGINLVYSASEPYSRVDLTKFKTCGYKNAFKYWVNLAEKPDYYPENYVWYNPELFITEIKKAWYATDSNYVSKVIKDSKDAK